MRKLNVKDVRILLIAVVIAIASLIVALSYFEDAFPEANIQFEVDRQDSETLATQFLQGNGITVEPYRHASIFSHDERAKIYLERKLGLDRANRLMTDSVHVWRWRHRWFQSKQQLEYQVNVSPGGLITRYKRILPEDAAGATLTRREARSLAGELLREVFQRSPDQLQFIEHASNELPNRSDHTFTWQHTRIHPADANYRYEITIQGDELGGYREYLHVPEAWQRDYEEMRSANTSTGMVASFFLLLTGVAMLVVFIRRARIQDIKWKTALIFGGIGFVLTLGSQLNSLPIALFNYSTNNAFGDFVTQEILLSLLQALMMGGGILFLTAAGEPLYRERYGDKLSLSGAFTRQGFRTKKFFMALVIGLVMTCFFMAYQTVFYMVASKFGAWSPADIPYSDLLNTAIPWIFVLLMGFFPAVSEEFISRLFSIPFLEKYLKVRWLAVLIPALIWGFGHAGYPNQPFYIRGIEVSIAGVIVGYLMLRFGIVAALIWHYTVDAFYTAFLLFRSGDTYYIISGAISAGIFLVPLALAVFFYLRKGGFETEADVTNADEGTATPPPAQEPAPVAVSYRVLPRRTLFLGILGAMILGAAVFIPADRPTEFVSADITKSQIGNRARIWLSGRADSAEAYTSAITLHNTQRQQEMKYLLERTSVDTVRQVLETLLYPQVWRVRYFQPLQKEEYRVHYHPETGERLAFQHMLPEEAPGDSLAQSAAVALTGEWLTENGFDISMYSPTTIEQQARPHRLDYEIIWEGTPEHWASIGEGKPQMRMEVLGGEVGKVLPDYKLPEEWTRTRTAQTLGRTVHSFGRIAILVLFGIVGIILLIRKYREVDAFSWKPSVWIGFAVALIAILLNLNQIDTVLATYSTTMPFNQYRLMILISVLISGLALGGVALLGTALNRLYFPGVLRVWKSPERYSYARDSVVTVLIALVGFIGIQHLQTWIRLQFPEFALFPMNELSSSVDTVVPGFAILGSAVLRGILFAVGFGLFAILWKRYLIHPALRILTLLLVLFIFVPPRTLTWGEWALQAGTTAIPLLWAGLIWVVYVRDNYLSYVLLPIYYLAFMQGINLYGQGGNTYIIHGLVVLAVLVVFWFWNLADALRHRRSAGSDTPGE